MHNLVINIKKYLLSLFWSSGVTVHDKPALGMLWFLVSIFTARLIFNILGIMFKNDKNKIIPFLLGFAGVYLGKTGHCLPLNFDISLAALFFIALGYLAKKYYAIIQKYSLPIFLVSVFVWAQTLMGGEYIELAARNYGSSMLALVEAVCGTIVVCMAVKAVCDLKIIRAPLVFFGAGSLAVLCVHSLEDPVLANVWKLDNKILVCAIRLLTVLSVSSVYLFMKNYFNARKTKLDKEIISTLALIRF